MIGVNKVILVGYVGQDPTIRYLENGRTQATFSLATHDTYKNKEGQKVRTTEWHRITLWTPLAEIAEKYVTKGKQIYLEGRLANRSYRDKVGDIKELTEIVGEKLVLLNTDTEL
jgi:single-strand DNA-binding protein